ncbi:MAG: glycosyltransferase family 4 protein [Deltaproteobacteria bacterium]|nr:glycosyltransferase family 4 protein [Deltaproteobacteria bacterium]
MGKLKIAFFIQGQNVAASRLRVLQYLPHLRELDIEPLVTEYPKSIVSWVRMLKLLRHHDGVFFQRKRPPLFFLALIKAMRKKVIFDFDDAIMFKNSLSKNPYSLRRKMSFKRIMRFSDLVIAGNSFLREEALRYNKNVQVLPTPINGTKYYMKPQNSGTEVILGWIGGHVSIHYLESYKEVWEEIGRRFKNVSLTIICDTFIQTNFIKINFVPWSVETEVEELSKIDIGIMPLFEDMWSRGKCGFKIIQYLGMGIPCVCTPVGINRDIVQDGVEGFWATTKEEWVDKISILVQDPQLRRQMGERGRQKVLRDYTVEVCAPKLARYIQSLFFGT